MFYDALVNVEEDLLAILDRIFLPCKTQGANLANAPMLKPVVTKDA